MQAELQLTHRRSIQDVLNLTATATARVLRRERGHAVSTATLVIGVAQRNMVEEVVRVHAELELEALRKLEVLHDGSLGSIVAGTVQPVKTNIADRSGCWIEPDSAHNNRGEVLDVRCAAARWVDEAAGAQIEDSSSLIRPADPRGVVRAAA